MKKQTWIYAGVGIGVITGLYITYRLGFMALLFLILAAILTGLIYEDKTQ